MVMLTIIRHVIIVILDSPPSQAECLAHTLCVCNLTHYRWAPGISEGEYFYTLMFIGMVLIIYTFVGGDVNIDIWTCKLSHCCLF